MYKFLAILLIIGTSQCVIPPAVKSGLKTAWAGVVTLACKCLVDEAESHVGFLPKGVLIGAFKTKVETITKKSAIDGFNALIDKARRTRRTGVIGNLTGGIKALGTGFINIGNVS
jgi:hypothetical protein